MSHRTHFISSIYEMKHFMPSRNFSFSAKQHFVKQEGPTVASFSKFETCVIEPPPPKPNTVFLSSAWLSNSYSGITEIPTTLFHSIPENSYKLHELEKHYSLTQARCFKTRRNFTGQSSSVGRGRHTLKSQLNTLKRLQRAPSEEQRDQTERLRTAYSYF